MSSFMVDDETINRVVTRMELYSQESNYLTSALLRAGIDTNTVDGWAVVGRAMFALNVKAVNSRYGAGEAAKFRPLDYHYGFEAASEHQAYKSLSCWLYQCSEGRVPSTRLYKFMEQVVKPLLADAIICDLPEYEQAQWG